MRSTVFDGLQGSFGGPGGPVVVQRGQGASWKCLGGPREVPGGSWGALENVISFLLEVNLSMV